MKKISGYLFLCIVFATKVAGQDFISDSLRSEYVRARTDSAKVSELIALSKYKWNVQRKEDTAITVINNAVILARQKGLHAQEVEAIKLSGVYYTSVNSKNRNPAKGYQLIQYGILLARRYHVTDQEIELLINLSSMARVKADSVKFLIVQAMNLARRYKLPEQELMAVSRLGSFYTITKPDSARFYYLQALALARQFHLPVRESTLLQNLANIYSLNYWGDSSHYLILEALRVARENQLIDREISLLRNLISSEGGFFIRDSIVTYYERMKWLSRKFHRDSLLFMSNFAQSSADMGNFSQALQTYLVLLHANEVKKDSSAIQLALYGIGLAYQSTKDYHKSVAYFSEGRKYGLANNFIYIFIHVDLAKDYMELQQNDSARYFAHKAYQLSVDFYGSERDVYGGVLNDLGIIYFRLGDDSLALDYLRRSYVFFTKNSIQYLNYCNTTLGLAQYFKKAGMPDSSFIYGKLCLNTALDKGFLTYLSSSSELVAGYFKNKHNTDSAYYYQQIGFDAYKRLYNDESSREFQNMSFNEQQREKDTAVAEKAAADQYKSNLRLYALITVVIVSLLIGFIVFRNNRHKQRSYDLLTRQKQEIDIQKSKLEESLKDLRTTQSQLIQSEKMASLGELTAGIAHEIQNPLNFVNNFSEVNQELLAEMNSEILKGNYEEAKVIAKDITGNEQKINHHGKRADAIVKGMLQHSRSSSGVKEPTDINALADEYLRLAYHGLRAKDKSFNATMKTDFDNSIGNINIIPQDIGRVILNLITNAFYAVDEKKKQTGDGAAFAKASAATYEPIVSVSTRKAGNKVVIKVRDNGNGITGKVKDKIFQPFFTTKPTGEGTGLGLSMSYDIVTKGHGGELSVTTQEGEYAEFSIILPL